MTELEWMEDDPDYDDTLDEEEPSEADDEFRRVLKPRALGQVGRYQNRGGVRSATWRGPGGQAQQIQFPKNLVTTEQLNQALAKVGADVKKVSASVVAVDSRYAKTTTKLDKRLKSAQQMSMMMMLLTPKPQLESFTTTDDKTVNVKPDSTKFRSSGSDMMLPLMLMMGSQDGGDSNSMLPFLLLAMK